MKTKRNILFIVLDSLRTDHLSCYGYHRTVTPFIDDFAKDSLLFYQAVAPKYETVGVHASWFTGLYSSEHGVYNRKTKLNSSLNLLPVVLRSHDYQTAGFSNNPFVGALHGMNEGFDTFYEAPAFDAVWRTGLKDRIINKGLALFNVKNNDNIIKRRAERTVEKIISWFENTWLERSSKPFFIFTNLMDTHYPHYPPREFIKKFVKPMVTDEEMKRVNKDPIHVVSGSEEMTNDDYALLIQLYDADIAYTDNQLKTLFKYMEKKKLLDNTIVIITSDHGDHFGENGLYGHMLSLSDVLIHVPLIIKHPDMRGRETDEQVGTINLFHTILAHCGIDPVEYSNGRYGYDLLDKDLMSKIEPHVFSEQEKWEMPEFANVSANTAKKCVRTVSYKYIDIEGDSPQLFDLKNDPKETHNIINQNNGYLLDLKAALSNWGNTLIPFKKETEAQAVHGYTKEDNMISERLRELGYL
jgi:arylsulfatase A-like enzyme